MSRHSIALVVVTSLAAGAGAAALAAVVSAGAEESQIMAALLTAFSSVWALLALLSSRWTDQPQRWAFIPAGLSAVVAITLIIRPGIVESDVAGWSWPIALLILVLWMFVQSRRNMTGRSSRMRRIRLWSKARSRHDHPVRRFAKSLPRCAAWRPFEQGSVK